MAQWLFPVATRGITTKIIPRPGASYPLVAPWKEMPLKILTMFKNSIHINSFYSRFFSYDILVIKKITIKNHKRGVYSQCDPTMLYVLLFQLVVIGCSLLCLQVKFSRIILIMISEMNWTTILVSGLETKDIEALLREAGGGQKTSECGMKPEDSDRT